MNKETIHKIRNRDQEGLKELYHAYSDVLYGTIYRIVKDEFTSQNILQKSFLKIWNSIEQYDEEKSTLFTWMNTIAKNSAIDKVRLKSFQNNKKTESEDSLVFSNNHANTNVSGIDTDKLLKKLESKYSSVLNKIYLEGYTQREVSELLDIPLGTVKSRLKIAIRILRDELKSEKKLFLGFLFTILILLWL